jgi:hypothetical protein
MICNRAYLFLILLQWLMMADLGVAYVWIVELRTVDTGARADSGGRCGGLTPASRSSYQAGRC